MAGLSGDALMGILFSGLILLIGIVGTLNSAKNTRGPKERAFATQMSLLAWILIAVFFATVYFLPEPLNFLTVVLYFAVFPFVVYRVFSRRLLIRRMEQMRAAGHKA